MEAPTVTAARLHANRLADRAGLVGKEAWFGKPTRSNFPESGKRARPDQVE